MLKAMALRMAERSYLILPKSEDERHGTKVQIDKAARLRKKAWNMSSLSALPDIVFSRAGDQEQPGAQRDCLTMFAGVREIAPLS